MNVLVACEYSGKVREAFRKLGHEAYSLDIIDSDDNSPYHIKNDLFSFLESGVGNKYVGFIAPIRFDLIIAHPPCTYLCNSGVSWLHKDKTRWGKMIDGANFFKKIMELDCPKIAIENPIMHKYAIEIIGRRQDQVIQPWQFGHGETKATCLWLKNIPKLVPTNIVEGRVQRLHLLPPSKDRAKLRSETYQGIADAMAEQWGIIK